MVRTSFVVRSVAELTVAVTESARGRGLGTTLIETIAGSVEVQGTHRVSLSVDARSPALGLYERLGFKPTSRSGTSITIVRASVRWWWQHSGMVSDSYEFYACPGSHTDATEFGFDIAGVDDAVEIVQGLLVYDLFAKDRYGVELSSQQAGFPARARCGFAAYFVPGYFEDHWVAEYWNADARRWEMIDAQLDYTWRRTIGMQGDWPVVVGPEQFLTAAHAWRAWRDGRLDAERCGLTSIAEHGAFWIAGNLRLDLAALNKVEMLPWDVWGLGWTPPEEPSEATLATFDSVAELTVDPDARFDDLRDCYESSASLRMDGIVFSVELGEEQKV